ncbi:MAG: ribosome recycling factor [Rickettsiales bacterium]|nr:ribosome recycling factor [Pseudomonadota bacterium]MDA0967103.1 ribosome recycling factor [Pseudomonadota bacterium]MDG4542411.1 ribosome recycling factor [Rickettsiales bacterium]MDG4544915.1 ribosome recycling factor [Rickettsiales bacterium]MDG4547038.1 ribosome recycling factor [Rickettsiales bacterium]
MSQVSINDLKKRMEGAIGSLHHDLKGLRTGRANAALLDHVSVEAYGSKMPLDQLATVSVPEARLLNVQVWDASNAKAVEKAISNAGLGLNPQTDGNVIRVPLPDLSEERRKEMVKIAGQYAEKARVAVRNIRRDGMDNAKKMEKDGDISKDEQHDIGEKIQKLTDDFIKTIDDTLSTKEDDIMAV